MASKTFFGPGTLVRIKNLEKFALFGDDEFFCESGMQDRSQYSSRIQNLPVDTSIKNFFSSLPLAASANESYVAEVVKAIYLPNSFAPQWIGVKFYTSLSANGKPANLWTESENKIFYYVFENILLLDKILKFESLKVGNLFYYDNHNNSSLIISHKISRKKNISTNAWTVHVIQYLSSKLKKKYLYPNRKLD